MIGTTLQFVNDVVSPGANWVYATDGAGLKAWRALSAFGVTSLTGTSGQITVSAATGAITLSLPTALTSINSITSAALSNLVLATGTTGTAATFNSATNALTLSQGALSFTGATTVTGGAGNMTIVAGTGASRTLALQTTTSGSTATTALSIDATQLVTLTNSLTMSGTLTGAATLTGTNSITAAASTDLTLNGGSGNKNIILNGGTTGNVGIGTTNPTVKFQVVTTDDVVAQFGDGSAISEINVGNNEASYNLQLGYDISNEYGYIHAIGANETTYKKLVLVKDGGNVLIGGATDITGSGGLKVFGTTTATTTTSGAFQVAGGAGIVGPLWVGGLLNVAGAVTMGSTLYVNGASNGGYPLYSVLVGGNIPSNINSGVQIGTNGTIPATTTTGAESFESQISTAAAAFTCATVKHFRVVNAGVGAGSAITTQYGFYVDSLTSGGTNYAFYSAGTTPSYLGGALTLAGNLTVSGSTAATAIGTASSTTAGGFTAAGNILNNAGLGTGVASVVTAAGTTTLTNASPTVTAFTGGLSQNLQLPAASLYGASVAVLYILKNRSLGNIHIIPAGNDTIEGNTYFNLLPGAATLIVSDSVSNWSLI